MMSQSLGLMISVLPYIRDVMTRHLPGRKDFLFKDITKMCSAFQDHREAVFGKLAEIVISRLDIANSKQFSSDYGSDVLEVSPCMRSITHDLKTMHKVLLPVLTQKQIANIFSRIIDKLSAC